MTIDISSGVGYGFATVVDKKLEHKLAELLKRKSPDARIDDEPYIGDIVYGLSSIYSSEGLTIETQYDENVGTQYLLGLVSSTYVSGGGKYQSVAPKFLDDALVTASEKKALDTLLGELQIADVSIGWHFYKIIW